MLDAVRQLGLELGNGSAHPRHPGVDLQVGLHPRGHEDGSFTVGEGLGGHRLAHGARDRGNVADPHGGAVAVVGDDHLANALQGVDLAGNFDDEIFAAAPHPAGLHLAVGEPDGIGDLIHRQAKGNQAARCHLDQDLFLGNAEEARYLRALESAHTVLQHFSVAAQESARHAASVARHQGADRRVGAGAIVVHLGLRHAGRKGQRSVSQCVANLRPGLLDLGFGQKLRKLDRDNGNARAGGRGDLLDLLDLAQLLLDLLGHQGFDTTGIGTGIGRDDRREEVGDCRILLPPDGEEGGGADRHHQADHQP